MAPDSSHPPRASSHVPFREPEANTLLSYNGQGGSNSYWLVSRKLAVPALHFSVLRRSNQELTVDQPCHSGPNPVISPDWSSLQLVCPQLTMTGSSKCNITRKLTDGGRDKPFIFRRGRSKNATKHLFCCIRRTLASREPTSVSKGVRFFPTQALIRQRGKTLGLAVSKELL